MRINSYQKFFLVFYFLLTVFWVLLFFSGEKTSFFNYLFSFLFGLIPLFGGAFAMLHAKLWGGLKSSVGKAIFFIGLGLVLWGSGETIWSYYNFFVGEAAPYPSLADVGFAPSIFFYGLGVFYLAHATGAKYGLRNPFAKLFAIITPFILLGFCYYLLVVVARGGVLIPEGETPLKTVLDIVYPLGDFLSLVVAVVISGLSFKYLGGKYVVDIISILLGLAVMTFADALFSYTTTVGTFYNGQFGDFMLMTGLFLITFGVLGFYKIKD